ncbi:MAG: hypothetical protein J7L76_04515 [Spirochaetaceae bacterium]|nr:hypothetical protein [Spirochaetaceae bacterium]
MPGKKLQIPYIESPGAAGVLEKQGVMAEINEVNWPDFSYQPEVVLFCGYTSDEILLNYRVKESHVRALNNEINAEVYKDSCVEFFISTGDNRFYNFEFNCIGTSYAAYGKREDRKLLDKAVVSRIRTESTLGNKAVSTREIDSSWELTIAIPFSIFQEKEFLNPGRHTFYANFYKCGDELPRPHFLSWNPIRTEKPDFHQPEYFGEISFLNKHP